MNINEKRQHFYQDIRFFGPTIPWGKTTFLQGEIFQVGAHPQKLGGLPKWCITYNNKARVQFQQPWTDAHQHCEEDKQDFLNNWKWHSLLKRIVHNSIQWEKTQEP